MYQEHFCLFFWNRQPLAERKVVFYQFISFFFYFVINFYIKKPFELKNQKIKLNLIGFLLQSCTFIATLLVLQFYGFFLTRQPPNCDQLQSIIDNAAIKINENI